MRSRASVLEPSAKPSSAAEARPTRPAPARVRALWEVLAVAGLVAAVATLWFAAWRGWTPEPLAWVFLRLSGVIGYVAIALSVALGALASSRFVPRWLAKPLQFGWHGLLSGFGLSSVAVHGAFSIVDASYPQTVAGVLVPGLATYAPIALGLGTLASYAMATVYGSFAMRRRLSRVWVKRLHLLAYPAFALSTLHGVFAGSDRLPWLYLPAIGVVALATSVRWLERRGPHPPHRAALESDREADGMKRRRP
jgi:methionine sulfoxide reductase heme-binding subunit